MNKERQGLEGKTDDSSDRSWVDLYGFSRQSRKEKLGETLLRRYVWCPDDPKG